MSLEEWAVYFAKQDQEKLPKESNIELEGRIEFWQMSQGGGVYKFLGEGISQGMGFKNPQDVWVISSGPPAGRGKPSTFETGKWQDQRCSFGS